jgi:hypothetical protein
MPLYGEGVKPVGQEISYTPEQVMEIVKCSEDIFHFLKYVKIIHPDRGRVTFKPWDYQKELINLINNNRFIVALVARQQGKSILVAAYLLWYSLFNEDKTLGVVSNNEEGAIDILDRVKVMYEELPDWLKPGIAEYNKKTITFENGTKIRARATSKDSFRGRTLNIVFADEFAFVDPQWKCDEFFTSNWPTISASSESKFIIVSCVTKDTMIFTNNGPIEFQDIIDVDKDGAYQINDIGVLGVDGIRQCDILVNNGKCNTKKIITSNSIIECSYPHKLWSFSNGVFDYHKSENLSVGDWLSIQYGDDVWGNNDDVSDFNPTTYKVINKFQPSVITKELAYFLGMFLAEGSSYVRYNDDKSIKNGNITLTCGDDISQCIDNIGLPYSKTKGDNLHYTISSKNLIEFLDYLGFDLSLKAKDKYIPHRLLSMSRNNIIYMLRGLFDGDGYSRGDRGVIGISMNSKRMIHQIRYLLLNFGILTVYDEIWSKPTKKVSFETLNYRIITNHSDALKFYDTIGFGFERKQRNRNLVESYKDVYTDTIPYISNTFKSVIKRSPFTNKTIIQDYGISITKSFYKGSNISRRNAIKLYSILKPYMNNDEISLCDSVISNNIKWVKITNIEDGYNETFDVALPDIEGDKWDHSVIYNGIIGHQTPKGIGNLFHTIYSEAEQGLNTFKHFFANYKAHPERDEKWAEEQRKNLGERRFNQEFLCQFIGSDSTLLTETKLKELIAQPRIDPIQYLGKNNALRIYEQPQEGCQYVLGVDVGKGTGEHYSTIQVFRIDSVSPVKIKQVAVFESNVVDVYEFSGVVNRVSIAYNNAYIMCENNAEGSTIVNQLWWEYENENLVCEGTTSTKLGVRATTKSKPIANLLMKKLIEDGSVEIVDYGTIQQFLTFLDMGNGRFGGNGNTDDLISAFYWACYFFTFDLLEESMSLKKQEDEDEEDEVWGVFGMEDENEGYEVVRK